MLAPEPRGGDRQVEKNAEQGVSVGRTPFFVRVLRYNYHYWYYIKIIFKLFFFSIQYSDVFILRIRPNIYFQYKTENMMF